MKVILTLSAMYYVDCVPFSCVYSYQIGLLDLTLKCIDKFRLRQLSIPSNIYVFKVSKKD